MLSLHTLILIQAGRFSQGYIPYADLVSCRIVHGPLTGLHDGDVLSLRCGAVSYDSANALSNEVVVQLSVYMIISRCDVALLNDIGKQQYMRFSCRVKKT